MANDIEGVLRRCTGCDVEKPLDGFARHVKGQFGRRARCRECCSEAAMRRNDEDPDIQLNAHLLRKFGISLAEFRVMEEAQNGVCAICGEPPTLVLGVRSRRQGRMIRPRLVVDHNHETGQVRGLLCTLCNRGIGLLGDSPKRVLAALNYLERE